MMAVEVRRLDRRSAAELRLIEGRIERDETVNTLLDIRRQATRVHLAVVAERPDLALHAAGTITSLVERRLRQMGGSDAA
jgi:hypothetical protein